VKLSNKPSTPFSSWKQQNREHIKRTLITSSAELVNCIRRISHAPGLGEIYISYKGKRNQSASSSSKFEETATLNKVAK
jgi:hypothetical protein